MNWLSPWFITSLVTGGSLLLVAVITWRNPPKKINHFYGYRTKRSKRSQEAWDFAQSHSLEVLIWMAVVNIALSLPALFIPVDEHLGVLVSVGVLIFSMIYLFWDTEQALKREFGE